jgi:hypothetical protein
MPTHEQVIEALDKMPVPGVMRSPRRGNGACC